MWKKLNETKVLDILHFVGEASRDGQAVYVGTDSLQRGRFTQNEGSNPSAATNRETRELSGPIAAKELIPPGRRCASPHPVIGGAHSAHGF
jgi:hypothetical protein